MAYIKNNQFVPEVETPSFYTPRVTVPKLQVPELKLPLKSLVPKQERKHVKDLGDIILGNPISGTLQLRHTLRDAGLSEWEYVPLLNRVIGLGLLVKERVATPIAKGNIKEALVNGLETAGSSLDLLANPVKSLMPWAGGGTGTDLLKSLGWIDNAYKENYQWNTGHWLLDVVGEMLSDPMTWVSLGMSAATKSANEIVDTVTPLIKNTIVKEHGEAALEFMGSDDAIRALTKEFLTDSSDDASRIVERYLSKLNSEYTKLTDKLSLIDKSSNIYESTMDLLKTIKPSVNTMKEINSILDTYRLSKPMQWYRTMASISSAAKNVDRWLIYATRVVSPLWGVGGILKDYVAKPFFDKAMNYLIERRKAYTPEQLLKQDVVDHIAKDLELDNHITYQPVYSTWAELFEKYSVDQDKLVKLYRQVLQSFDPSDITIETVEQKFKEELSKLIPDITRMVHPDIIDKELKTILDTAEGAYLRTANSVSLKDIQDLTDAIGMLSAMIEYNEAASKTILLNSAKQEVSIAWNTKNNRTASLLRLNDINNTIISTSSNKYSLNNLDEYMDFMLKHNQSDAAVLFMEELNYYGITLENSKEVFYLLNAINQNPKDKSLIKQLAGVLESSKIGIPTTPTLVEQNTLAYSKFTKDLLKNDKLNIYDDLTLNDQLKNRVNRTIDKNKTTDDIIGKLNVYSGTEVYQKAMEPASNAMYKALSKYSEEFERKTGITLNGEIMINMARDVVDVLPNKGKGTLIDSIVHSFNMSIGALSEPIYLKRTPFETLKKYTTAYQATIDAINNDKDAVLRLIKETYSDVNDSMGFNKIVREPLIDFVETLSTTDFTRTVADIKDLIQTGQDLYTLKISDLGLFNAVNKSIAEQDINEEFMTQVLDYTSDMRKNIKQAIKILNNNDQSEWAKKFNYLLATLDNNNNINGFINYAPLVKISNDKTLNDLLQGEVYNFIHRHNQDWFLGSNTEERIKQAVEDYMKHIRISAYKLHLSEDMYSQIEEAFRSGYIKFANNGIHIGAYNNIGVNIGQCLTWNTSLYAQEFSEEYSIPVLLNNMGFKRSEVIEALNNADADLNYIFSLNDLIMGMCNETPTLNPKVTKGVVSSYILRNPDAGHVSRMINNRLNNIVHNSIEEQLTKTLALFKDLNDELAGKFDEGFGKTYYTGAGKRIRNNLAYLVTSEVDDIVKTLQTIDNRYAASTINEILGFKKQFDQAFIKTHNILPDIFMNIDDGNYIMFYKTFEEAYSVLEKQPIINTEDITILRKALAHHYSSNIVPWGPKNPELYFFSNLTDLDILTWDAITKNKNLSLGGAQSYYELLHNINKAKSYTYTEKAMYRSNPASDYFELKDTVRHNGIINSKENFDAIMEDLNPEARQPYHDICVEHFSTYAKDPESLGANKENLTNYINRNVSVYRKLTELDELAGDPEMPIENLIFDYTEPTPGELEAVDKELSKFGISTRTPTNAGPYRTALSIERGDAKYQSIERWTPIEVRGYLDHDLKDLGWFIYSKPKYIESEIHFGNKFTDEELAKVGVLRKEFTRGEHTFYIFRKTDNEIRGKAVPPWLRVNSIFGPVQSRFDGILNYSKMFINNDDLSLPLSCWDGHTINEDVYKTILTDPELADFFGDIEVQKAYTNFDELGHNLFFKKKTPRPSVMFLGDIATYNNYLASIENLFTDPSKPIRYSSNTLDKDIWGAVVAGLESADAEQKFAHQMFNKDFSLDGPMVSRILEGKTDAELNEFFSNEDFVVTILKENNKGEPHLYKYSIHNKKELAKAIEQNAVLVPKEMYRTGVLAINSHKIESNYLRFYVRTLAGGYKTIYITTSGFIIRNGIDTALVKNAATTGGTKAIFNNLQYNYKAEELLKWFNNIQAKMRDYNVEHIGEATINNKAKRAIVKTLSKEDQSLYMLLDIFMNSGASGGLSKTMQDILLDYNLQHTALSESKIEKWLDEIIFENPPVKLVNNINDTIEQTSRLGLFLNLVDNGLSPNAAINQVIKTHFDYSYAHIANRPVEQVFWFSTFPINNLLFYLNDGLTKNPDLLKLQMDMIEQSWNSDDITWDDVRKSNYLTYNVLAGNLRFKVFGKNIILKTSLSVIDFYNCIANPLGEAIERLNPFLAVLLGAEQLDELNPFTGNVSRIKQRLQAFETGGREGSYLPSIYATMYPKREYRKYYPKVYNNSGSSWHPKPRRKYLPKPRTYYLGLLSRPRYTRARYSYLNKIKGPAGTTYAIGAQPDVVLDNEWKITASPIEYKYRDGVKKHIETLRRANISQTKKRR